MEIKCRECGHQEPFNLELMVKIIGGSMSLFGSWAWIRYLFAGTGLALPICMAIVAGGLAVAAFSTEIASWLCENYDCPKCGCHNWNVKVNP